MAVKRLTSSARRFGTACVGAALMAACSAPAPPSPAAEADAFVRAAETRLLDLRIAAERASWVHQNFISDETTALAAAANAELMGATAELAAAAARFDGAALPDVVARKLLLLRTSLAAVAPADDLLQQELAGILADMEAAYSLGVYCPDDPGSDDDGCLDLPALERILAE